ncbi:hypothetical protein [Natronorubrum sp. FCH18a]|uniref:hypothetical protein n=1 Tax=Natronorubrum sp. FCH18a TaxID=3447018 RepID=UPI003F518AB7
MSAIAYDFALLVSSSTAETLATVAVFAAVGAIVVLRIIVDFERLHALASSGESSSQPSKINCPSCGARTTADGVCDYCAEPLTDDSPDGSWTDETRWS